MSIKIGKISYFAMMFPSKMNKRLSSKMQKYLARYLSEFNSSIRRQRIANSDGQPNSLFTIIIGELSDIQAVKNDLTNFDDGERKELKDYLIYQIEQINNRVRFYLHLNYVLSISVVIIVLLLSYFSLVNYLQGNILLLIVLASISLIVFKQKKLLDLQLEYELLLTYLS